MDYLFRVDVEQRPRGLCPSCWFAMAKIQGEFLWGAWENQQAQEAWRAMPQRQELLDQCRELCEEG